MRREEKLKKVDLQKLSERQLDALEKALGELESYSIVRVKAR